ncbi:isoaspartyl peptidase/L-asparaginase [Pontibacter sp. BT310]|uniref:Isoaspartyl peptidase/L-asparaginase n=1 Tax=Pontibacter populi TaxID=890055 RepID=A0ABS6XF33_9BACT|nr:MULTISPECIES: isoaspartyl peptidase/L-asparaginase [Pontibacter]MBJ6119754.1 isoaspartyl peptidase/L-asparaginase [Pontibacter sp. BT310]MBR0572183.1 isoaspartyl peptidase/L-asparaginase [Microvirga sp. STS03]MBW3366607.1 isoaspartyl peptidase/L-asparaginase [Pontibacter populi]
MGKFSIAIHGGAGTITPSSMTPALEVKYKEALHQAIERGSKILASGGKALDAVQKTVEVLENTPLFNAGKGSVFTKHGMHEMDAAIMCGKTLQAGAAAGVYSIKNPVSLAREILEHSDHVFMSGYGAEDFARKQHIEFAPEDYFFDMFRYKQWCEVRDSDIFMLDHTVGDEKFGTVGAVALDMDGNLAAATSTGGMTNKNYNRIGDTPVIGAGTYANNDTCAISCTGHGEYFLRAVVAYDISCLMEYKGYSLQQACEKVVMDKLVRFGGEGGLIAVDALGNIAMPFNSEGMYRACQMSNKPPIVAIYKDEIKAVSEL